MQSFGRSVLLGLVGEGWREGTFGHSVFVE